MATTVLDLLYQLFIINDVEYSTDHYKLLKVSGPINILLTLPVAIYWQRRVLYRLVRILQGEYTTLILDLLYQLFIINDVEYSTDH